MPHRRSRPVIVNGVGPAAVVLPSPPQGATYLRIELACYDGTLCATPGGSVASDTPVTPALPMVQRDALPLTGAPDPTNAQDLPPLNPAHGLPITVNNGTHWRLYAVYTDSLNPTTAPLADGKSLGIPGNAIPPNLVPAVATNGRTGWIDYDQLTAHANPTLTRTGLTQAPIPVFDQTAPPRSAKPTSAPLSHDRMTPQPGLATPRWSPKASVQRNNN